MPVQVKGYKRRKPAAGVQGIEGSRVIIVTPDSEVTPKERRLKRIKKNLVTKRKKRVAPRTHYDDIAEGADKMVNDLEALER